MHTPRLNLPEVAHAVQGPFQLNEVTVLMLVLLYQLEGRVDDHGG